MIPRWVEDYLAIPYVLEGRDHKGCDCWGLPRLVLVEQAKLDLPVHAEITAKRAFQIAHAIDALGTDDDWRRFKLNATQCFDIILMSQWMVLQSGKREFLPVHMGVMVTRVHVLHTELDSGPACVRLNDPSIVNRVQPFTRRHRLLCKP